MKTHVVGTYRDGTREWVRCLPDQVTALRALEARVTWLVGVGFEDRGWHAGLRHVKPAGPLQDQPWQVQQERNHVLVLQPCMGHGTVQRDVLEAGSYTIIQLEEVPEGSGYAVGSWYGIGVVKFACGHERVERQHSWEKGGVEARFADRASEICFTCYTRPAEQVGEDT